MKNVVSDMKQALIEMQNSVIQQDTSGVQISLDKIITLTNGLKEYSPDELSQEEKHFIKELMNLTEKVNELLQHGIALTTLAINETRKFTSNSWYA